MRELRARRRRFLPARRAALLIVPALLFATGLASAQVGDSIVASTPGGVTLSAAELREELSRLPAQAQAQALARATELAQVARAVALRRELARQAQADGLDKNPAVAAALREARERILAEAALARPRGEQPDPGALERLARNQYDAAPEKFTVPEQVRVRHILVSPRACEPEARARELLALARRPGADFAALAREHSDDAGSAARGGDLGLVVRGKTAPAFEQAAFALRQPGELSEVVRTDFGYHIIKLDERMPARRQSFESVRESILKGFADAELKSSRQQVIDKAIAEVELNHSALEAIVAARDGAGTAK
jgi:peptidyl-prolyl cis-trans isomerase C